MNLRHVDWRFVIPLQAGCYTLVWESPALFERLVTELVGQMNGEEGGFFVEENYEDIPLTKALWLLCSPYMMDVNEKKIITRLYKEVEAGLQADYMEEYLEIERALLSLVDRIQLGNNLQMQHSNHLQVGQLLKSMNLQVEQDADCHVIERLYSYVDTVTKYFQPQGFVCVQFRDYFMDEQLSVFAQEMKMKHIGVIFLESHNERRAFPDEIVYTIDESWCELYE